MKKLFSNKEMKTLLAKNATDLVFKSWEPSPRYFFMSTTLKIILTLKIQICRLFFLHIEN
jgi:hypothetical protein